MPQQVTRWSPDSCLCVIDLVYEGMTLVEARFILACDAHLEMAATDVVYACQVKNLGAEAAEALRTPQPPN